MAGIIKNAINKQINANKMATNYNTATGTVLEYDISTNTAIVKYHDPNNREGTYTRENVPVSDSLGGLTGCAVRAGTKCTLTFLNGNIFAPIITGLNNCYYQEKTTTDQGAYLVSESSLDYEIDEIEPMINDWIDEDNNDPYKYDNDYTTGMNTDADVESYDMIRFLDKYGEDEQGITNLLTKANIKLKNNGDIDIFVKNNTGIRISPARNEIELFGNVKLNGKPI